MFSLKNWMQVLSYTLFVFAFNFKTIFYPPRCAASYGPWAPALGTHSYMFASWKARPGWVGWSIPEARAGACESGSSASPATLPRSTVTVSVTEQTKLRERMINALEIMWQVFQELQREKEITSPWEDYASERWQDWRWSINNTSISMRTLGRRKENGTEQSLRAERSEVGNGESANLAGVKAMNGAKSKTKGPWHFDFILKATGDQWRFL